MASLSFIYIAEVLLVKRAEARNEESHKTVLYPPLVIRGKNYYSAEAWCHYMKVWGMTVLLLKMELSSLP